MKNPRAICHQQMGDHMDEIPSLFSISYIPIEAEFNPKGGDLNAKRFIQGVPERNSQESNSIFNINMKILKPPSTPILWGIV